MAVTQRNNANKYGIEGNVSALHGYVGSMVSPVTAKARI